MIRDEKRAWSLDRITVIAPVKDEEESIARLLRGILQQTYQPSEVILTDGGSRDRTKEIIREHQATYPVPLILVETQEALPGRGRNLAISRATNEWLACIDAGIMPRPDWLEQLIATARQTPSAQVIYGKYEPVTDTYFTECAAITYLPTQARQRSIASCLLRRDAWAAVGGFREDLRSGEDLLFFREVEQRDVKEAFSERAIVEWQLQPTISTTFRRFTTYSHHGMRARLGREWQFRVTRLYLVLLVFLAAGFFAWPFFLMPPFILLLRAEKRVWSWFRAKAPGRMWLELLNPRRVLMVAAINVVIDFATFYGLWQWIVRDRSHSVEAASSNKGDSPG